MLVISMFTSQAQNTFVNSENQLCLALQTDTLPYWNSIAIITTYLLKEALTEYDFSILEEYNCLSEDERKLQNVNWLLQEKLWVFIVKPESPINSSYYFPKVQSVQKW